MVFKNVIVLPTLDTLVTDTHINLFRVVENSPSDQAGLKPGDIVTHINGNPVHGTRDVYKMLESSGSLDMSVVTHMGRMVRITVHPEDPH